MKTYLKIFFCFCLFIHISGQLVAQTVTDPAASDPSYESRKRLAAQTAHVANPQVLSRSRTENSPRNLANVNQSLANNATLASSTCFIPRDNSYTAVPRNDDGSFGPIALPFNYNLYGTNYRQFWINTNGNLTFTRALGEFNANGFPIDLPMVAAFWADIETSPAESGAIYFKISDSNVIVTWDGVGYFPDRTDKLNTFQIIITNGLDPIIGAGNNTAFYYKDMQWTTGEASEGVNGFGGNPATVGINKGNSENFIQVGRFNLNSSAYDGPGGNNDGINYLDNKCFDFNVGNIVNLINIPPSVSGLPADNTVTVNVGETANISLQFIGPEVGQAISTLVDTRGLCSITSTVTDGVVSTVNLQITGAACNVGTHTITLQATDNGSPSQSTMVNLTLNIRKKNQEITFDPIPAKTFGALPFTVNATASSGLPVSFSILSGPATISENTVTLTGAGAVVIQAMQAGNGSYNTALPMTQSFQISKATQNIYFAALPNKIIGDAPFSLAATATSGLPVSFSIISGPATLSSNSLTVTGPGIVTVRASQAGNINYLAANSIDQSFNVSIPSKQTQTISFTAVPAKTFGDAPFLVNASASSGLPVNFTVVSGPATISGNTVTLTGAGTVNIQAMQIGNDVYNAATPVQFSFEVQKAAQTISFTELQNKMMGDAPFTVSATATSGLPVSFAVVSGPATISGNTVTLTGTGTVVVRASQLGNGEFLAATDVDRSFEVQGASEMLPQTITFAAMPDKMITDAPFMINASASSGLPVSFTIVSGPATIMNNMITIWGGGQVVVQATQPGNTIYQAAPPVTQSFRISKLAQDIVFTDISDKAMGDAPFELEATNSSGLPVNYMVTFGPATLTGNQLTLTGPGLVIVKAFNNGNNLYEYAAVTQSFMVTEASQSIAFAAIPDKVIGDAPFMLMATASSGLPVSYRIISGPASITDGNKVKLDGAGQVVVQAMQPGNATFQAAPAVTQSFRINKIAQNIVFTDITDKVVGDAPFALEATNSSGLPVRYTVTFGPATLAGNWLTVTGPGLVIVKAYNDGNGIYEYADVSQRFMVATAPQSIAFAAKQVTKTSGINVPEIAVAAFKAYPNPFADAISIEFVSEEDSDGLLQLYSITGELLQTLHKGGTEAGRVYLYKLDGNGYAAGIYMLRLVTNGKVQTKRIVLVK